MKISLKSNQQEGPPKKRGGARPGAGRPRGSQKPVQPEGPPKAMGGARPGAGRPRGNLNRKTLALKAAIEKTTEELRNSGGLPLEYMLSVMRNPAVDEKRRDAMAIAAAPYLHARLAAVTVQGDPEKPVHLVNEDAESFTRRIAGLSAREEEDSRVGAAVH